MNRLHNALSPYLQQHADNPVHWQPWDDTALQQARRQDKPILLSIGYAACHWCHVMAHESFEDEQTAAQMNRDFINIKVDREERPDIDRIYQAAHYLFARRGGGWPLTMILTPDGEPFFGGTYFPKHPRHGLPAFTEILTRVMRAWNEQRDAITTQNQHVLDLLRQLDHYTPTDTLTDTPLQTAAAQFAQTFDDENGGLGDAPKFPHPVELSFCMHHAQETNNTTLSNKVKHSLEKMAASGLHDHLGGGFYRYCVDAIWHIPHFEKMLYDNGQLLALYAEAAIIYNNSTFARAAETTARWALDEMREQPNAKTNGSANTTDTNIIEPQTAFYAALDADSPEGEGAYYLWSEDELQRALTPDEHTTFASHVGLHAGGARLDGKLHILRRQTIAQTAAATGHSPEKTATQLDSAFTKLRQLRRQRIPPATDDKLLTAWNALMVHGLARAARLSANPQHRQEWQTAAQRAFDTVWQHLRVNHRTKAARRGSQLSATGYIDDIAFLLDAALELLRLNFTAQTLAAATELATELCTHHQDSDGGFHFTADDSETLIRRPKASDDSATPSGNGIALQALQHLTALTGDPRWQTAAIAGLKLFHSTMQQQPMTSASLLSALQQHLTPPSTIYLTGDQETCQQWQQQIEHNSPDPGCRIYILPADTSALPQTLQKTVPTTGAMAHQCHSTTCLPPVTTLQALKNQLEK